MSFESLLQQSCTYSSVIKSSPYGDLQHGTGIAKRCRFSKSGLKVSQISSGSISQKSASLWIDNKLEPKDNDKVVYAGTSYTVKFIDQWVDGNGQTLGYKLMIEEYV